LFALAPSLLLLPPAPSASAPCLVCLVRSLLLNQFLPSSKSPMSR
jgi:hypothetical protein